ncbi:P-loop containing nucleoside triphosphate hydrolase protein [Gloeopeniophorella convolvens]|nr:P-loop containing nucleoside triphosphate hydrolase protein [Gloeopeniophorella convolvens]
MDSVSVPPPPVPQPPPRRPFAAADEYDRRQGVQSGITSDSRANNATEDNSIEILPPDIDGSTSIFPSVARLRPRPVPIQPDNKLKASPHYPEVIRKLRDVFHLEHFRKNQLAAIISTLEGRDALVLMPTGGGKSLCYQLPAVCTGGKTTGVTVVISPLLALMEDQVECLRADNIDAMDFQEDGSFHAFRTAAKKPDLLYITPEKLSESDSIKNLFKGLHSRQQIARFVIDEAHLISTWGRGFRSHGYDAIRNLREEYPGIPIMALTATATSRVLQDIVGSLRLKDYVLLSQSFNRPNLRYTVVPKGKNNDISIVQFIQEKYPHDTGIIYCLSRDSTEFVARRLMQQGFKAKHYHAGMDKDDRKHIQKEWQRGEIKIMIATIAFGMGVNKADVRYVIHYDLPGSIDAYCQETGRAGRDGKHADCILYFNGGDVARRISMFKKDLELNEEERERSIQGVRDVGSFCLNDIDCRRVMILQHFEEPFSSASCHGTCDNCASVEPISELDLTASAIKFVNLVKELEDRTLKITSVQCIHAFRGTQPTDMERRGFHVLNGFATGKDISADLAKRMVDHLLDRQILINELEESQVQGRAPISYIYVRSVYARLLHS